MGQQHGYAILRQAVEEALKLCCSDTAAVRYLLTAEHLEKSKPEVIELGELIAYERPQPTLEAFDQLLMKATVGEVIQ
jgi:hypothetical protein